METEACSVQSGECRASHLFDLYELITSQLLTPGVGNGRRCAVEVVERVARRCRPPALSPSIA